jgi:hypothetical protein
MKSKIMHSNEDQKQALYDPDPLTILLSIVTALTPVGVLIVDKRIDISRENKRRSQNIRNSLFSATRALNETERVLKDFISYLDQQGLLDRDVRLGGASLIGDYSVIAEAKTLYKDSYNSGRKLNDAMIELSRLLENRDFNRIRNISGSLEDVFQQTLSFKKYKDFAIAGSRLIQETRNLIAIIGEGYDFNPTTSLN